MANKLFFLTFFISTIVLLSGCASEEKAMKNGVFEFDSGGIYHLQGYGGWKIKLDIKREFSITHNVRGRVKKYGTFLLTEKENSDLWELICAVNIEDMKPSQRARMPDEVEYTFTLKNEAQIHSLQILINDARKNNKITILIGYIAILIEKYTGERPFLR